MYNKRLKLRKKNKSPECQRNITCNFFETSERSERVSTRRVETHFWIRLQYNTFVNKFGPYRQTTSVRITAYLVRAGK